MIDFSVLPIKSYEHVRPEIQTGDLVVCSGRYWFSKLIQRGTNSQASHCGILVKVAELDRVLLLESVETHGTRFVPFSRFVWGESWQRYKGEVVLYRLRERPTLAGLEIASRWALDRLTASYSYRKIAYLGLRLALKTHWLPIPPGEAMVCSEFCAEFYRRAGIRMEPPPGLGIVPPSQFTLDPRFELIDRVL